MSRAYFTLVASLPALDDFERARRIPISRPSLARRLAMLEPEDRVEAQLAVDFLTWNRQPTHPTDAEVLSAYDRVRRRSSTPLLRAIVEGRLQRRTIQAALRRRHLGAAGPSDTDRWGSERVMVTVRRNWTRPDFGLGAAHPWIPQMVELLEAADAVGLERLLMRHSWDGLARMMAHERPRFSFGAVLLYLFQWDIAHRWIDYDAERSQRRFEQLSEEAWNGFEWN